MKGYRELLPKNVRICAPRSFDIVGDIAILRLSEVCLNYAKIIGEAILKYHRNINTVCIDRGVETNYRIRNIEVIAGERKFITIHKEYGCKFKVDLSKVYFSPRLATERWRIVEKAKVGEKTIDMFAGVGPFSILLAKYKKCRVVAIDINPYAIKLMKENIKMNKVENFVVPLEGDARSILEKMDIKADRIIMNLPKYAFEFLDIGVEKCRKGGTINYYEIVHRGEEENRLKTIREKIKELGYECKIEVRKIREYSPSKVHYGYEITLL